MPYKLVKVKGGYKIQNLKSGKFYSSYPLTRDQARRQLLALLINTK